MSKGQGKSGKKSKSINLPKRRCQKEGCSKLAKYFKYRNNKITVALCNQHSPC